MKTPRMHGLFGAGHDGLLDPEMFTAEERARTSPARLREERARRRSMSPVIRRLQAATDRALGRGGKR